MGNLPSVRRNTQEHGSQLARARAAWLAENAELEQFGSDQAADTGFQPSWENKLEPILEEEHEAATDYLYDHMADKSQQLLNEDYGEYNDAWFSGGLTPEVIQHNNHQFEESPHCEARQVPGSPRKVAVLNSMSSIGQVVLLQLVRMKQDTTVPLQILAGVSTKKEHKFHELENCLPDGAVKRLHTSGQSSTADDGSSQSDDLHTLVVVPGFNSTVQSSSAEVDAVQSCVQRGLKFIVLMSSIHARTGEGVIGKNLAELEKVIRETCLPYCILRLPMPTEFYLSMWMEDVVNVDNSHSTSSCFCGTASYGSYLPMIALKDIGRIASQVTLDWKNHTNQVYTVASEVTCLADIRETLKTNLGVEIDYKKVTAKDRMKNLIERGCSQDVATEICRAGAQSRDGVNAASYHQVHLFSKLTGDWPTTLADVMCSPMLISMTWMRCILHVSQCTGHNYQTCTGVSYDDILY